MIALRQTFPRVPGAILALVVGTAAVMLTGLGVETVGSRFGGVPEGLPELKLPDFKPSLVPILLRPALTVALLGAIESLLSAVVADRMGQDRHNPNTELVAQGIANIASPMFGGLPATGAIARTATNIRCGARSPVAGMVHAAHASRRPSRRCATRTLRSDGGARGDPPGGVVQHGRVARNPQLLRLTKTDIGVWLVTFALTVVADLTVAVEVGMVLAALLVHPPRRGHHDGLAGHARVCRSGARRTSCRTNRFPSTSRSSASMARSCSARPTRSPRSSDRLDHLPQVVIIRLRNMTAIDATGLRALEEVADRLRASDRTLVLCGAPAQPAAVMRQARFHQHIGEGNICLNIAAALNRAEEIIRTHAA